MPLALFEFEMVKLIGAHCKNFSELKVFCPFVVGFAKTIATYIPNLKVLSLQGSLVEKEALVYLLNNTKKLEVLNLCHCLIVDEGLPAPGYAYAALALDMSIMERASEMKNFLVCNADYCHVCQLMFITEGNSGWSDIGIWRRDMVSTLAAY
uniref:F-box/LRR-repeat protein At3g48880-like n=1 Tax=Fragaria vesca subsp. vesca TaxID=101020 RepID=UPI0005CACC36|nr:PREDICTED: F-box/LRR-repeat protein At3g48880-like [Fragaria vesca subsp. vesca]